MIVAGLPLGNIISALLSEGVPTISVIIADWLLNMQEDRLLKLPGAYVIAIELNEEFVGRVGSLGQICLKPGQYLYFGNARGPGGIRARIKRHLRVDKKTHWHIDRVTLAGQVVEFLVVPDGCECSLREKAMALTKSVVPVLGFGSSDCRLCPAHFLAVSGNSVSLLRKLAETAGGKIYSVPSLLPTTAAQPSTV